MPSLELEPAKKEEDPAVNLEGGGKPDGFGEGPEKGSKEKEEKPEEDRPEPDMFLEEEARFLDEEGFRGEEEGD